MQCYICGDEIGSTLGMCEKCKNHREATRNPATLTQQVMDKRGGAAVQSGHVDDEQPTVGFWVRVMAQFVDSSVISILSAIISAVVLDPLLSFSFSELVLSWCFSLFGGAFSIALLIVAAVLSTLIVLMVSGLFYASLFESSKLMATPGKLLFAIRVCDLDGKRLTFVHAFKRQLAKIVSSLTFGIGYILVAFTQNNQGLHDLLAKTVVIKGSRYGTGRLALGFCVMVVLLFVAQLLNPSDDTRTKSGQRITTYYK
jgi:uncharacterized RDD family membrane protein YckC